MFSQDTISIIFYTSKLDFLNHVVVSQKTKASSFRGICMYVKRIRKIKNYKERVVILKIVKDMDSLYLLHGEEHHWMSPLITLDDWWGS